MSRHYRLLCFSHLLYFFSTSPLSLTGSSSSPHDFAVNLASSHRSTAFDQTRTTGILLMMTWRSSGAVGVTVSTAQG